MFAVHSVLIAMVLPYVRRVNIWIWGLTLIAEGVIICIGVAPGFAG